MDECVLIPADLELLLSDDTIEDLPPQLNIQIEQECSSSSCSSLRHRSNGSVSSSSSCPSSLMDDQFLQLPPLPVHDGNFDVNLETTPRWSRQESIAIDSGYGGGVGQSLHKKKWLNLSPQFLSKKLEEVESPPFDSSSSFFSSSSSSTCFYKDFWRRSESLFRSGVDCQPQQILTYLVVVVILASTGFTLILSRGGLVTKLQEDLPEPQKLNDKYRSIQFGTERLSERLEKEGRILGEVKDEHGNRLGGKKAAMQFIHDRVQARNMDFFQLEEGVEVDLFYDENNLGQIEGVQIADEDNIDNAGSNLETDGFIKDVMIEEPIADNDYLSGSMLEKEIMEDLPSIEDIRIKEAENYIEKAEDNLDKEAKRSSVKTTKVKRSKRGNPLLKDAPKKKLGNKRMSKVNERGDGNKIDVTKGRLTQSENGGNRRKRRLT